MNKSVKLPGVCHSLLTQPLRAGSCDQQVFIDKPASLYATTPASWFKTTGRLRSAVDSVVIIICRHSTYHDES